MEIDKLKSILEALFSAADKPLTVNQLFERFVGDIDQRLAAIEAGARGATTSGLAPPPGQAAVTGTGVPAPPRAGAALGVLGVIPRNLAATAPTLKAPVPAAEPKRLLPEGTPRSQYDFALGLMLQKQDFDQQMKNNEIVEIVTPMFDFALMAKLSLGRKYWPVLPQEKKERFTELFIKRLRASYLDNLASYTDEQVTFEPPLQVKSKVHISTFLISKNRKTSMLYKLYKSKDDWKIYDVEIQGVSVIRSYRSQFDATLQKGDIDDLLLKLERPADN